MREKRFFVPPDQEPQSHRQKPRSLISRLPHHTRAGRTISTVRRSVLETTPWGAAPDETTLRVDLVLIVLKALAVALVVGALLLVRTVSDSRHSSEGRAEHPRVHMVLRYPQGWSRRATGVVSLSVGRRTAVVWLERLSWSDMEAIRTRLAGAGPCGQTPFDTANPLPWLTCYLRIESDPRTRVVATRLGGRRAMMAAGRRSWDDDDWNRAGWGAVVVATGADLLFMHMYAPSLQELDAVWEDWLWMIPRVQVTDREPVRPILK